MMSVKAVKQILSDWDMSDSEAERLRDELRLLAEIIFEEWRKNKQVPKE